MKNSLPGLLDVLAEKCGCDYLSDLRNPALYRVVGCKLEKIPAEQFPVGQWQDAVQYFTGITPRDADPETLRQFLLRHFA